MNTNARVLVVDDDESVRQSYWKVLVSANFVAQIANGGNEALSILAHEDFDVVLLGCVMSGDSGLDVLRAIKELCPDTEVVVIAGTPSVKQAKESIRLGACDYLVEPVPPEEMIRAAAGAALQKKWALHRVSGPGTLRLTH